MKKTSMVTMLILSVSCVQAQIYFSKNATVSFFSKTTMEDIKADNNQALTILNPKTGEMQFSLNEKNFHFSKPLMEEHFNENYMESEKYPKATFKGQIADLSKVNFTKDANYKVTVKGDLNMHGVTKNVIESGNIIIENGKISSNSKFIIALSDFNITIPKIVQETIQKTIEISVSCKYEIK